MRKILTLFFCIVSFILAMSGRLSAQYEFDAAHQKIEAYWAGALRTPRNASTDQKFAKMAGLLQIDLPPLISRGIETYLNSRGDRNPENLTNILVKTLSESNSNPDSNLAGVTIVGANRTYVVAYDISTCISCSTSWLGMFEQRLGKYTLAKSIINPAPNQTINLAKVGEQMVLLSGTTWGDAHSRLQVRLYAVKDDLREVWSSLGLPSGEVIFKAGADFSLTYRTSLERDYHLVQKDYHVSENSADLLKTRTYDER